VRSTLPRMLYSNDLGPFSSTTFDFLKDLGRRISNISAWRWQRGSLPFSKNLGHDSAF